jgi:Cu/Zn superoxide dismutase
MFRSVLSFGRKSPLLLAACASSVIGINCSFAASRENPDRAVCTLGPNGKRCDGQPDSGSVTGEVSFEDDGDICRVRYLIVGLKPGKHGFHMYVF